MLTKMNQTKIIKYDVKLMFIFYVITDILRRKLFFMAVKAHKSLLTSKIQIKWHTWHNGTKFNLSVSAVKRYGFNISEVKCMRFIILFL